MTLLADLSKEEPKRMIFLACGRVPLCVCFEVSQNGCFLFIFNPAGFL